MAIFFRVFSTAPTVAQSVSKTVNPSPSKVLADRIKQCIERKSNLLGCLQTSLSDAEKEFRTEDNYRMRCEGRIPPGEAIIKITAKDVTVGEVVVDVKIKINEEKTSPPQPPAQPSSD